MKDKGDKTAHEPSGFFVLRTPSLPLSEWLGWGAGLRAADAAGDDEALERALAEDRAALRGRLRAILARPEVWEAYFLAAPGLDERIGQWLDDPDGRRGRKMEHSLTRYLARMSARPTPFGLFAGFSTGTLGAETRLAVAPAAAARRHTRLDADYLSTLVEGLTREGRLRDELLFRPNSSLHQYAGRVRYVVARVEGRSRSYHLVTLDGNRYLRAALGRAERGVKASELALALADDDVTPERARTYVSDLIDAQVLVPDFALTLTGPEAIHPVIAELQKHDATREAARVLAGVRDAMSELDRDGVGLPPARYRAIARTLEELPAPVDIARLFQVDIVRPAPDAVLGEAVVEEMLRGLRFFRQRARDSQPEALRRFAERFTERYEEREVPLLEALDEESGVGFEAGSETSPLLRGVDFPTPREVFGAPIDELLLKKLTNVWARGEFELVVDEKDAEAARGGHEPPPLPDALAVQATLAAEGPEALARGEFQLVWHGAFGPSGARLLGRFCHADAALHEQVAAHLRAEEAHRPDAVFAEVVHLPAARLANVLSRPALRDFEITYLGRSGVDARRQIPASDLLVYVRDKSVRLRSRRLGREVIPRLTSAHNYRAYGLGPYRFLCLLQDQRVARGLSWSWGPLAGAPFLPRVRMGRLVLAPARWAVTEEEARSFKELKGAKLFAAVLAWRDARGLPRHVNLREEDNVLPVDFDNVLSVEAFAQALHAGAARSLTEFFPAPSHLCASSPEGLFTHELVVPFVRRHDGAATDRAVAAEVPEGWAPSTPTRSGARRFPPGSEWLYAKLYVGTATADRVLCGAVREVASEMKRRGVLAGWYFIRYGDPDWHLRVRWHGEPERLRGELQPHLAEALRPYLESDALRRVQFDTYEREVERYGGPAGIELSEDLFHADSEAVLGILEMLEPGDAGLEERWRLACAGVDLLLEDFGLTLKDKDELLRRVSAGFAAEFGADKSLQRQLGEKFRAERRELAELLEYGEGHPLAPGVAVLRSRSVAVAPIARRLRAAALEGRLTKSVEDVLVSYVHMHVNRMLRSAHRQQELVLYHLLARHYDSLRARGGNDGRPRVAP